MKSLLSEINDELFIPQIIAIIGALSTLLIQGNSLGCIIFLSTALLLSGMARICDAINSQKTNNN